MRLFFTRCLFLLSVFFPSFVFSQMGKDGARTISALNTVVNEYTTLSSNAVVGATTIAVGNSNLNVFNRFPGPLATGDLIMIIQLQGATISTNDDSTYGAVTNYNNCGNYELRQVSSIPSATSISISCGLSKAFTATGRTLVVRVPRYTTLTVNSGASITCPAWDGTQGGVVAIEAENGVVVNTGGSITATGKGFRGGALLENLAFYGVLNFRSLNSDYGAEKGEGIAGYQADYDALLGRNCKGAPANGGGGANAHNAGGGGGGNASALPWNSGRGTPDPNAAYTNAWNLEYTGFALSSFGGGGRGGYSFASSAQNVSTLPPGNTAWGGDYRRVNGGLGGRPLDYSTGRIFMGGGGGAGDQNDSKGGVGGPGGGIVFITTRGTVNGGGVISSDGNAGANSAVPPLFNTSADGAGGAGAGGTILLDASGTISGISINANGGTGGTQNVSVGNTDTYGPGGGGGGGFIAISNGAVTRTANGGNNGTCTSGSATNFPPNGATRGTAGLPNQSYPSYSLSVTGDTICQGSSTTLTANVTGTLPTGSVISWYATETSQNPVGTGINFTTPPLSGTTTYYVGTCPGYYRIPVTVEVGFINAFFTAPTVCTGANAYFSGQGNTTLGSIVSWSWDFGDGSPTASGQNVSHAYATPGSYLVTLTVIDSYGCQSVSPTTVSVQTGPLINYSLSNTSGCPPLSVTFNNSSLGATGYTWGFGDGGTSTQASPTHTYTTPGVYSVYLVATNGNCTDTLFTNNVVNVVQKPTSSFTVNTSVCLGDTSVFTNQSNGNGSPITSYLWDFGDGSPTTGTTSPRHYFSAPGSYQVRLTSTAGGCSDDTIVTITVAPTPNAAFTPSALTGCTPAAIVFSNNSTGSGSYAWTFGDGGTSAAASPSHVYSTAGVYTVTLIVTQGFCSDTVRATNLITIATSPRSSYSVADSVCFGVTLPFSNNSTGNGSTIIGYAWDFGDGSPVSNQISPVHYFSAPGTYQVRLTVSTAACSDDSVQTVYVGPTPVVAFTPSTTFSCTPTTITFSNTTTGTPSSYSWNFGDGGAGSSQASPSHFYGNYGTYTVTLIATKDFCTDTGSATVTISPTPVSQFAAQSVCQGDSVRFTNLSTIQSGTISGYTWDFGDASPSSTITNPAHFYNAPGVYQVRLTATAGGCSDDTLISVTVNPTPVAAFSGSPLAICSGSSVLFTNSTTGSPLYTWDFGDGSPASTVNNPSHTYSNAGTFTVSLIAVQGSCSDTLVRTNLIAVTSRPFSSFSTSDVCFGQTNSFNNLSTGSGFTSSWDFGDGTTSSATSPTHQYGLAGVYVVGLTVTSGACTDDTTISVTVSPTPIAGFSPASSVSCGPTSIQFVNTTTPAASYTWNFGDGSASSSANAPLHNYSSTGNYSVSLIADLAGCLDTVVVNNAVQVLPFANASFSAPSVCLGDTVRFTDLSTSTGGPVSYSWDFGDGATSTAASPSHYYSAPGIYLVRQSVLIGSCSDDTTISVSIGPAPIAAIGVASSSGCAPFNAVFTNNTTGSPLYYWDFGDGAVSNSTVPSHLYTSPGTYTVEMVATQGSCSDTASVQVVVAASPAAAFSAPATACAGDSVRFTSTGSGGSLSWDFGDGSPVSSSIAPAHVYASGGTYVVTLQVSAASGCSDTATASLTVSPLPTVNFSSNILSGCDTLTVGFTPAVTGASAFSWSFGDGSTSSAASPIHTYTSAGTYSVVLTASNSLGCSTTRAKNNYIVVRASPVPQFSTPNRTICRDACVAFTATSSGAPTSWTWSFPGALPSSAFGSSASPVCYPQPGSYDVSLTVTDGYCTRTIAQTDYLDVADCSTLPTAGFIVSDSAICTGSCVDFVSLSLNATAWAWIFPGGVPGTSNVEHPTNICYPSAGNYGVTLIAINPLGVDTFVAFPLMQVDNLPPVPAFSQVGDTLLAPPGYGGYQWYYNNIPISGATGQQYTATLSGNYAVEVYETSGCSSRSPNQRVSLVGIEEVANNLRVDAFPNPFKEYIRLNIVSNVSREGHILLRDALGRMVFSKEVQLRPGPSEWVFQWPDLAPGAYFLHIDAEIDACIKVIKY